MIFIGETAHFHFTFNTVDCQVNEKHLHFISFFYPWLDMTLASLAPFVIMAVTSSAIIFKLMKSKKKLQTSQACWMTVILISITLAFFVTTLPICICVIALHIILENEDVSQHRFDIYVELWACANILLYLNNAGNFALYCLTGRRFRKELVSLLRSRSRVRPSSSNDLSSQRTP